jgi:hypothetical protein
MTGGKTKQQANNLWKDDEMMIGWCDDEGYNDNTRNNYNTGSDFCTVLVGVKSYADIRGTCDEARVCDDGDRGGDSSSVITVSGLGNGCVTVGVVLCDCCWCCCNITDMDDKRDTGTDVVATLSWSLGVCDICLDMGADLDPVVDVRGYEDGDVNDWCREPNDGNGAGVIDIDDTVVVDKSVDVPNTGAITFTIDAERP